MSPHNINNKTKQEVSDHHDNMEEIWAGLAIVGRRGSGAPQVGEDRGSFGGNQVYRQPTGSLQLLSNPPTYKLYPPQ